MMYSYNPLCPGQDFHFHLLRLQTLMDALSDGRFFPSYIDYTAAGGYGYFTKAFYSDVILIPFAIVGNYTSALFGYQLLIFTCTLLCGIFTYQAVNAIYKNSFAAIISALLYTFCAYRLLDIYSRAALGEAISFTFLPLVFWGLFHIIKGDYRKWYILAIGFSLMIFTHLISSVLMFVTVIIFLFVYNSSLRKEPKRVKYILLSGIVTLLVTAYYIFPMLEQMFSNSFYYEARDIMSKAEDGASDLHWMIWGMFTGIVQPKQLFVPGIGIVLTIAVFTRLFVYEKSKYIKLSDGLIILGLVFMFAISSLFPWKYFPFNLLNFIQLPFRLYEFISFFFAVAGGYYLTILLKSNKRKLIGGCIIIILILINLTSDSLLYKDLRGGRSIEEQATLQNSYHLGGLEYFPDKLPSVDFINDRTSGVLVLNNVEATVHHFERKRGLISLNLKTDVTAILELPLVYYKGYKATFEGNLLPVSESPNGLVQIKASKSGFVEVYYGGTIIQKISWFISILSVLGLCVYIVIKGRISKR